MLHTTYASADGRPQAATPSVSAPALELEDWSGRAASEVDAQVAAAARRRFDLSSGPLWRALLFRLEPERHVLALLAHEIVADVRSLDLLAAELVAAYAAGGVAPRDAAPQFTEWAAREPDVDAAQLAAAVRALEGAPTVTALPADHPRPPAPSYEVGVERFELPEPIFEPLRALLERERIPLFAGLLAALQLALFRWSGQDDVLVGTPLAFDPGGTAGMVGPLTNTLVLRGHADGDPTLRELLQDAARAWQAAQAHAAVPFDALAAGLGSAHDLSANPLAQVALLLEEPAPEWSAGPTRWRRLPADGASGLPRFDLVLVVEPRPGAAAARLEYDSDLFTRATVARMAEHVRLAVAALATRGQARLGAVSLLGDGEARQLQAWNATAAEYPRGSTLHELVEAGARRAPDDIAVAWSEGECTQHELHTRANRLARHLGGLGVGPESRVGVCVERGAQLVPALLGVLKAGAAYVPLDPAYPTERVAFMLRDAGAAVLLTQDHLVSRLPTDTSARVVRLDSDWPAIAACPDAPPAVRVDPENLAYVIYTSGSTGRPKGVALTHRSAVAFLSWCREVFGAQELSATLASTSICFDLSVFEIFAPLAWGGRVIVARDALELTTHARAGEVTLVNTVPSAMRELLRLDALPPTVRTVNLAGEPLPLRLVQDLYAKRHVERVYNLYGPSEDTTYSTFVCVPPAAGEAPTIGRPLPNTRTYVLDRRFNPVPIGVAGELYIAGDGLARGYFARPELTAERFVPDPFAPHPGGRLYRTGDLVRQRGDGELIFLGRIDHQVKIRGFRIELGEIEEALRRHPAVAEAVVVARAGEPPVLVAYFVARGVLDPAALREHLRRDLPEYMLPGRLVPLERLPLTPNGKIDRKALPAPDAEGGERRVRPPRTPTEEVLVPIFAELLGLAQVGTDESFFLLGGHSLLATRLVSRVREALRVDLPLTAAFENPSVEALARRVDVLRREGLGLLALPLARGADAGPQPASFAQERLWVVEQLTAGRPVYNLPVAWRLTGELDVSGLARALGECVRRHEALRTVLEERDGRLVQRVQAWAPVPLPLDTAVAPEAVERWLEAEIHRPFDLARDPLLRARLLRLDPRAHVLVLTLHHIAADGWSLATLCDELGRLYAACASGAPSPLPELPVQYGDYARWQRQALDDEHLAPGLAYWRRQLAGAPPLLELPADRPRPARPSFRGERCLRLIPPAQVARLETLAREEGATLFMALLAALAVLLGRRAGRDDLVIGSPIAHRTRGEVEGLIGFFVNTLALRIDLSGEPTFRELLARVRRTSLDAYAHQDVPFERVVEALQPERALSHNPLVQVMAAFQSTPAVPLALPGMDVAPLRVATRTAKFDLAVFMEPTPDGLRLECEYAQDLFDAATVARVLGHLCTLLEGAAGDPGARIGDLPLLTDEERREQAAWNATAVAFGDATIVERVRARARERPAAQALGAAGLSLSYAELDQAAERLAGALRRMGVGVESRVAVCLTPSPRMVVAALGVLQAGGTYVALDPAHPAERLAFMLRDAGARAVFADETADLTEARAALPELLDLRLDERGAPLGWPVAPAEPRIDPACAAPRPDQLAYIIYTSGSTGWPKGVGVPHRGLANLVDWHLREYALTPADRTSQVAAPGFDAVVWEVWPTLAAGASLHFPPADARLVPRELTAWLARERISVAFLPTPLAEALMDEPLEGPLALRVLLTGGDRLTRRPPRGAPFTLVNHYGPTEVSVVTTAGVVAAESGTDAAPSIGRPIANLCTHVLDARLQPVPAGVPGELCIGGAGVARGYLNRPDLTAERFVPDPFGGPGARLYRTGDLVRWRADGALDFLGRADHQVKVRGFRIELGEIEAALRRQAQVAEAVVVARAARPGEAEQLVGYVVPRERFDATALLGELRRELPEYMLPARLIPLERLPLSANGKLDRRALPEPDAGRTEVPLAAPVTPDEQRLAAIWTGLLGLERVGADEDFFALGGHSLLAARLVARVRESAGVELPLTAVFEERTIQALARRIDALRQLEPAAPASPLVARTAAGPLPASFAQERLWFVEQLDPGAPTYNLVLAYRVAGALDTRALALALDTLVTRHEALRTTLVARGGRPYQQVSPALPGLLRQVDLSGHPGAEAEALRRVQAEAAQPFDLAAGPLLRVLLLRTGADAHVLCACVHHVVFDGWSVGVFLDELARAYTAHAAGRAPELPVLPVQYGDYAAWQREEHDERRTARQLAYWRGRLSGSAALDLPTDFVRPVVRGSRGATLAFELDAGLHAALTSFCRREGVTPFMTALAAYQALLARYTGRTDVVVGAALAHRPQRETEGLIGFFVNTLPLRTDLGGEPGLRELVGRVKSVALGAYAHQDLPAERLLESSSPGRGAGENPLFRVLFFFHMGAPTPRLGGLTLTPLPAELVRPPNARAELTLTLEDQGPTFAGALEYSTELFERATVERLARHYERLLRAGLTQPDTPFTRLPLLSPHERARWIVVGARALPEPPGAAGWVHEQVAARAGLTPEAVAVEAGAQTLTYGALRERVGALALRLREAGVGPEVLVGLYLERTPSLLVALLAVLEAGGAYLPLDPRFPRQRLEYMLADSGTQVVLASPALRDGAPAFGGTLMVIGDEPPAAPAAAASPPVALHADSLAYVLYTSGSTGRPKGVAVSHGALANFLESMRREPGLAEADRLCAVTTLSFDIAALELLLPLVVGARVVLADETTAADGSALARLLERSLSTVLQATPATWRLLLESGWGGAPELTALCGGEALPRELAETLRGRVRALWNMYGPTETTVWSTCGPVGPGTGAVSIGRPLRNTRVHVLDAYMEPTPPGVPGELYIGGDGLARGYLGRPELSAERFVPDPFGPHGARLYRTGDLARQRDGGTLEVLGRVDQQVKVRGYRIEPGEVEAALARHPGIAHAVVAARPDGSGEHVLVAWYVASDAGDPGPRELREFLRRRVPDYMLPTAWVALPALPLLPNGKLDRRALPAPAVSADARPHGHAFVAPRTPLEQTIAEVWMAVLGQPAVGVDDSFFELGGHSLLAAQAIARLRERLGVELSLRSLFEAPSVAELAARVAAHTGAAVPPAPAPAEAELARAPRDGELALSFGQERLWFLHRLAPELPVYNIPIVCRLHGTLDVTALEAALAAVARRHEVLRTVYPARLGRPCAVVLPPAAVELERHEIDAPDVARREARARAWVDAQARRAFDLERGPVFRAALAGLTPTEHVLVLELHHIAGDLASIGLLLDDLGAAYAGVALAQPDVQYVDYAAWQRRRLEATQAAELDYWRGRLAGSDELELPGDHPRPPVQSFRGATLVRELPLELAQRLEALAATHDATLFMVLAAALQLLLHRVSGQDDVVLGSAVGERERPELQALVGLFVNMLALRGDLSGDPSFRELLRAVRDDVLAAHAHRGLPFERLVEELRRGRGLDRSPIVQVVLLLEQGAPPAPRLPGLRVELLEVDTGSSKFDLTLAVQRGPERFALALEYATDLFEPATVERLAHQFEILLHAAAATPEARVSTLEWLSAEERRRWVVECNATARPYPREASIHELFEAQAQATPDATALVSADESLSYAELERRANRLARRLAELGVGPETAVAVYLERSVQAVTALLAVLKAGGAYLPIEPGQPRERLMSMLRDAGARRVLTQARFVPELPDEVQALLVEDAGSGAAEPLHRRVAADGLAYVMYTSGSTGTPKGIAVPHRAVVRLVREADYARFGPDETFALLAPLSFDASTFEIWGALLNGARLALFPPELPSLTQLSAFLHERAVTTLWLTAGLFHQLAEARPEGLRPLRQLLAGGDVLQPVQVRRVLEAVPGLRLINGYGPTENTTFTCCHTMRDPAQVGASIPIGRPIAQTRVYVLDAHMRPVPAGVAGELCVGGDGLARGYVAQPALTAERFVPDALGPEPGARLYRTGDRARWRDNGTLEFLGRLDRQVKVRGFRIEPGEIETVLAGHPAARDVVVVAREDAPGDKRLVAYVVPRSGDELPLAELRERLRARLPEYMLPAAFVALESLPLNANGKVDRARLPAPAAPSSESSGGAPTTEMETLVARTWSEVLRLAHVGTRTNFFDVGGNSLLLLQVQSRLGQALGREPALMDLFRHPTVEALARHLGEGGSAEAGDADAAQARDRAAGRREALARRRQREVSRR